MPDFCPKCHTQAYDDTSFFCHKCGAQLVDSIPKKINAGTQNITNKGSDKKFRIEPYKSPISPKASLIHSIKPIEICAQCGGPINDNNRIFCKNCGANIREVLPGEGSPITKQSVYGLIMKEPVVYLNPKINAIKELEPVSETTSSLELGISTNLKATERKSIFILAGITILFFILMLIFLLL